MTKMEKLRQILVCYGNGDETAGMAAVDYIREEGIDPLAVATSLWEEMVYLDSRRVETCEEMRRWYEVTPRFKMLEQFHVGYTDVIGVLDEALFLVSEHFRICRYCERSPHRKDGTPCVWPKFAELDPEMDEGDGVRQCVDHQEYDPPPERDPNARQRVMDLAAIIARQGRTVYASTDNGRTYHIYDGTEGNRYLGYVRARMARHLERFHGVPLEDLSEIPILDLPF